MNNTGTKQVRIMKQTAFKKKEYTPCLNIRYLYLLNKYIKCNFGGYRCGTSIIVDIRRLKVNVPISMSRRKARSLVRVDKMYIEFRQEKYLLKEEEFEKREDTCLRTSGRWIILEKNLSNDGLPFSLY